MTVAREILVAGRYRIEGRLGSGGMSTVRLAFDERLERYVAVKLLAEHLASDPAFVNRFQREALAAARLIHPNIVQVFDSGLDDYRDQHYIVMEYIDGQSCAEILRDRGWLPVEEALPIILGSCAGLDYAHRKGVVHRDVKPGNLLRDRPHRQARRFRDRQGDRAVEHHAGRIGPRHRRLSGARAGPRRGGRAAGRHLRARRRRLPADLRPAPLRGRLADRARDQAAARAAAASGRDRGRRLTGAGGRDRGRAADRPPRALPDRGRDGARDRGGRARYRTGLGHGRRALRPAPAETGSVIAPDEELHARMERVRRSGDRPRRPRTAPATPGRRAARARRPAAPRANTGRIAAPLGRARGDRRRRGRRGRARSSHRGKVQLHRGGRSPATSNRC